jgi:hypothetical protein
MGKKLVVCVVFSKKFVYGNELSKSFHRGCLWQTVVTEVVYGKKVSYGLSIAKCCLIGCLWQTVVL